MILSFAAKARLCATRFILELPLGGRKSKLIPVYDLVDLLIRMREDLSIEVMSSLARVLLYDDKTSPLKVMKLPINMDLDASRPF